MRIVKSITFIVLVSLSLTTYAQNKTELGVKICLQSPQLWNGSFLDITTEKDQRLTPALGAFVKYHATKYFIIEYDIDLSLEGGGFQKRHTDIAFLKNTLFLGLSSNTIKNNSVNIKLGFTNNLLIVASMNDQYNDTRSNVSDYFKTSSFSFPISLGYVRRLGPDYMLGFNTYFQTLSGPLSTQDHVEYAQTLQRFEVKISKYINNK